MKKKSAKTKTRGRSEQSRPRAAATVRSTAGAGFDFEDHVGAWLLLKMLSGETFLGLAGFPEAQLQTQARSLGWEIDDLLATFGSEPATAHVALSCKSNQQVSASGLPADFVKAAWKQWDQTNGPMSRERDHFVLVTRLEVPEFKGGWSEVKKACEPQLGLDPQLAMARVRDNARQRSIAESITAPRAPDSGTLTDADIVRFIQHLHVITTDFDIAASQDEAAAIRACRKLLVSGDLATAKEIWKDLVAATRTARLGNGTVELNSLWAVLRGKYPLNDHLDYVGSWKALRALTDEQVTSLDSALPNKFRLSLDTSHAQLVDALQSNRVVVLYGESGAGKSALAKTTLDSAFPDAVQVWLGPEQAALALSEISRSSINLAQPLLPTLLAASAKSNILVIDAAERLTPEVSRRFNPVIGSLATDSPNSAWRVLIITQTQGYTDGLYGLVKDVSVKPQEIGPLELDDVKAALRSSPYLRWLATETETIKALTNLRALAWVMEAESKFSPENKYLLLSPISVADRVWEYWTGGNLALEVFLTQLGVREAEFQHSVALSELTTADANTLQNRPSQMPIRINSRRRVEFQHDLAGEWARFQRLKEIAFHPEVWGAYVSNPLWTGALRMLGQFLLREQLGENNAWDAVYGALIKDKGAAANHAADILLDALCLDPFAEVFLGQRAEFLLADSGAALHRLLRRFHHIASISASALDTSKLDSYLKLYLEATQRVPVIGRWPGIVRFLSANRDKIAPLISSAVADVCLLWLTTMPAEIEPGRPFPYRRELAELALAMARELQVLQGGGRHRFLDDSESRIYAAVFAAAPDCPDEVAAWALEMAQRRPWNADVLTKMAENRRKQRAEHEQRQATDEEYRKRVQRKEKVPTFGPSVRHLPPWPLAPKGVWNVTFGSAVCNPPRWCP